jgi:hypothetical protein
MASTNRKVGSATKLFEIKGDAGCAKGPSLAVVTLSGLYWLSYYIGA